MTTEESNTQETEEEIEYQAIAELTPRMNNINVTFKVVSKSEVREVISRRDNETQRISDASVGDATGTVIISLWNDAIEKFEIGKTYILKNAYTGLFRGNLRLKIGNESEILDSEQEIEEVNLDNDLSEVDHGFTHRRDSYRPRSGGYSGYREYGSSRNRSYGRRNRPESRRRRW
jgi:replication factor A1